MRTRAEALLGQRTTVDLAFLKPGAGTVLEPAPGIALVFATTWDEQEQHAGGELAVLVKRGALDNILESDAMGWPVGIHPAANAASLSALAGS